MAGLCTFRPVFGLIVAFVVVASVSCSGSEPAAEPPALSGSVGLSLAGDSRPLPAGFYGLNGANFLRGVDPADPRLLAALGAVRPPTIRVFGGTTANYWHWQSGKLTKTVELPRDLGRLDPIGVPLERWKQLLDAAGAEPLFDLNMVTSTLDDQLAMLRAAQQLGMPVERVELGNELYINQPAITERFPTPAAYRDEARQWISALRAEFPGVEVAVVGGLQRQGNTATDRKETWNREIDAAGGAADAVTMHLYFGSGLDGDAPIDDNSAAQVVATVADRIDEFRQDDLAALPTGKTCWVTEFNLFDRETLVPGSWLHGLVVAQTAIGLTADPRVGVAFMHALVGNPSFAALFGGEEPDDADGGDGAGPGFHASERFGEPFTTTAAGAVVQELFRAAAGATTVQALDMRVSGQQVGNIVGLAFDTPSGRHLFVANLSSGPAELRLQDVGPLVGDWTTLDAAPATFVNGPDALNRMSGAATGSVTVPPWSVTVVA